MPQATWWAERCSFSEPLLSSGPAPLRWGLNSLHLSIGHSPWSSETEQVLLELLCLYNSTHHQTIRATCVAAGHLVMNNSLSDVTIHSQ